VADWEFLAGNRRPGWQGCWPNEFSPTAVIYALDLGKSPENALIDKLYLSTRKNRRFARLPEVDIRQIVFSKREFERLLKQLPIPPRIAVVMRQRWDAL